MATEQSTKQASLAVKSTAFSEAGHIPRKYTCEGDDINPSLEVMDYPEHTRTLAIIMEDPDAPGGTFLHWLVWNLYPNEPITEDLQSGVTGLNSFGKTGYGGPCPPSGTHRYFFKVYALDTELDLAEGSSQEDLLQAIEGHTLGTGSIMGKYKKQG